MARRLFEQQAVSRQPSAKNSSLWGLVLTGFAVVIGTAFALPQYRLQAIKQFHYKGSTLKKSTMACTFCHVQDSGGAPWNPFGENLRKTFRENPDRSVAEALYLVLEQDLDSDGDGYSDVLEVYAHTFPGNAENKPEKSVDALKTAFEKAGGLEQYAPVAASK
ncbi:thrombospondin type 3 repeat-containing protein [Deinococcus cellulosilyticus]|uniref:Uncharacterized protein n=1 Tax=Deinococcus cellulosilyticus (strain DSM 18568 / NBRC 106333 / KACC 11606 / 5516J-15) TaxID=1223518 RepID=A0A511N5A2_DEIC1|nr:thrombospondin type 3 repeat-containing protein [Deinococcus cellulosilyticus]GEM48032.1 hypothetical protein DC3_36670 [Deinococcus cellulosilyticus NBRC 106333 = KACC 11606]